MNKLFMNKDFFFLLLGQFVSVLGERISTLVFFSIAVSILGNETSFLSSALIAVQFTPLFLFGYYFGTLADKYNQKLLMIISDIFRALAILILIFFMDSIILLYIVVFLIGLFTALFEPSKKSLIPFIVKKKELVNLNKLFAMFEIFAIFLGLLIGTLLLEYFTYKQALIIDLGSYLFSMFLIIFIRYKPIKKKIIEKKSIINDFKQGFLYLKKTYNSRHVILNITLFNFFAAGLNFSSISNYTIKNSNGLDPGAQMGIFLMTMAIGALFTPIFNKNKLIKNLKDSTLISYIFLIGGFLAIVLSLLMKLQIVNYYELIGFFFISGILVGLIYTRILYLLHLYTNEKYYGRVISINDITTSITTVIGILIGGILVDMFSYVLGFLVTGLIFILGFFYFQITKKHLKW